MLDFLKKKSKIKDLKHFILVNNYIDTKSNVKDHVFSYLKINFKEKKILFLFQIFCLIKIYLVYIKILRTFLKKNYLFKENYISLGEFIYTAFDTFFNYRQFKIKNLENSSKLIFLC